MVGDCVGHDLGAATVMGQLRSACRALLLQDASPGQVLAAMDRFAASVTGAEFTTVFCAVLEPATGQLTYSAAGHPPAIVAHPDGGVVLLEGARSFPLAAAPRAERQRGRLRAAAALHAAPVHRRARRTARPLADRRDRRGGSRRRQRRRRLPGGPRHQAHGAASRRPEDTETTWPSCCTGSPLRSSWRSPPTPGSSDRSAPSCAAGWRAAASATPLAQDALVAAGEAVANAIEHGHRDHPGQEIRLLAAVTANRLRLTVADSGRWQPPASRAGPVPRQGHRADAGDDGQRQHRTRRRPAPPSPWT